MAGHNLTARVLSLSAASEGALAYQSFLGGQSGCGDAGARWRVIEVFSESRLPFQAEVTWSAGGGGNLRAHLTVSRGTRVAVFARTFTVRVANLSDAENTVSGVVADADTFVQTHNQLELTGQHDGNDLAGAQSSELEVPFFARHLHVYLHGEGLDPALWGVRVYDGQNILRSSTPVSTIPSGGLEVGGARKVELYSGSQAGVWRAVFTLAL